ncbi:protein ubiquitination [Basidiobolus ranarum]|uniref:Protein ubiquitination n=1 Tax=Basidiobolus ranarum TaxID=34480 RepID=A0ABR2VLY6_9FUNG
MPPPLSKISKGLLSRELGVHYDKKNTWYSTIPERLLYKIEDVTDLNEEIKTVIILGFMKDGYHLLSYQCIMSEEHYGIKWEYYAIFWEFQLAGRLRKVATTYLFDSEEEMELTAAESKDERFAFFHGRHHSSAVCIILDLDFLQNPKSRARAGMFRLNYTLHPPYPKANIAVLFSSPNTLILNSGEAIHFVHYRNVNDLKGFTETHTLQDKLWSKNSDLFSESFMMDMDTRSTLSITSFQHKQISFDLEGYLSLEMDALEDGLRIVDYNSRILLNFPNEDYILLLVSAFASCTLSLNNSPQAYVFLLTVNYQTGDVSTIKRWTPNTCIISDIPLTPSIIIRELHAVCKGYSDLLVSSRDIHAFLTNHGVIKGRSVPLIKHPSYPLGLLGFNRKLFGWS